MHIPRYWYQLRNKMVRQNKTKQVSKFYPRPHPRARISREPRGVCRGTYQEFLRCEDVDQHSGILVVRSQATGDLEGRSAGRLSGPAAGQVAPRAPTAAAERQGDAPVRDTVLTDRRPCPTGQSADHTRTVHIIADTNKA